MKSKSKSKLKKLKGGDNGYTQDDKIECEYFKDDENDGLFVIDKTRQKDDDDYFIEDFLSTNKISIHNAMIINNNIYNILTYLYVIYKSLGINIQTYISTANLVIKGNGRIISYINKSLIIQSLYI